MIRLFKFDAYKDPTHLENNKNNKNKIWKLSEKRKTFHNIMEN